MILDGSILVEESKRVEGERRFVTDNDPICSSLQVVLSTDVVGRAQQLAR